MGAEGAGAATRSRIAQHLTEFMASLPADADLAAVTMKQVKQALAERLGEDEWACVLRDHKDYLKEQALERLEAASKQRRAAKPAKKKRRVGGEGRGGAARSGDKPAGAPSCQHGAGGGSRAEAMDVCQICFRQENDHQTLLVPASERARSHASGRARASVRARNRTSGADCVCETCSAMGATWRSTLTVCSLPWTKFLRYCASHVDAAVGWRWMPVLDAPRLPVSCRCMCSGDWTDWRLAKERDQ